MRSAAAKLLKSPSGPKKKTTNRSFSDFYKEWLSLVKNSLLPLLRQAAAARSPAGEPAVTLLGGAAMVPSSRLLSLQVQTLHHHFQAYYQALDSAAGIDVSQILSPPWRSSLEKSFLWFGDLHPSLFLNLLHSFLGEESAEIWRDPPEILREEMKEMECRLRRRLPQIVERHRQVQAGFVERAAKEFVERGEISSAAAEDLASELAGLFLQANRLRKSVLEGIVEVLDDCQAAAFLEKLCELVLSLGDDVLCKQFRNFRVST